MLIVFSQRINEIFKTVVATRDWKPNADELLDMLKTETA